MHGGGAVSWPLHLSLHWNAARHSARSSASYEELRARAGQAGSAKPKPVRGNSNRVLRSTCTFAP
ncbi:hypothetical protein JG688_00003513 [Phytophthora aleatoria]|uniref:Uncharacterized protein n=1 Tax=Phytophthora aleatoria TaxID=2496075 RepID=A0A8J5MIB6_9STRA|nr:hypothetical protein JG688_00003513 [Phytophthora aleatoria]